MNPERIEVMAPAKKAAVTQNYPMVRSTAKKMTTAKMNTNTAMNLYSAAKKAAAPLSM